MSNEITQRQCLLNAEQSLELGPVALAKAMGVPYDTYRNWKSERRTIPAVGWKCLELLMEIEIGKKSAEIVEIKETMDAELKELRQS